MMRMENEMNVNVPLEVVKASEIEPKEVKWLWYPYIPFGKVTLLQGDPGDGKSKLMLSIAALLSKGEALPFTDEEIEPMSNGSMFAHLEKFKSKDFWSEHRMITFNTLTDKQEYEIVAVFRTVVYTDSPDAFKFYRFVDAKNAEEFNSFAAQCKKLSFYDTGVTAEYGDKLITLSTCEYSRNNSRLVVVAKRITEDGGADAAKTHAEATAEGECPN